MKKGKITQDTNNMQIIEKIVPRVTEIAANCLLRPSVSEHHAASLGVESNLEPPQAPPKKIRKMEARFSRPARRAEGIERPATPETMAFQCTMTRS